MNPAAGLGVLKEGKFSFL